MKLAFDRAGIVVPVLVRQLPQRARHAESPEDGRHEPRRTASSPGRPATSAVGSSRSCSPPAIACGCSPGTRTSSATSPGSSDVDVFAGDAVGRRLRPRGDGGHGRRLLPAALAAGGPAARGGRARDRDDVRGRRPRQRPATASSTSAAWHPRSPRPRCPRTCARGSRSGRGAAGLRRADRRAARGRDHRLRIGVLRDAALPHRAAARDDHAPLGAQRDPADRHPRRAALPRRRHRPAARRQPHVRHRRPGSPDVPGDDDSGTPWSPAYGRASSCRSTCSPRTCRATGSTSSPRCPRRSPARSCESLRHPSVCHEHDIARWIPDPPGGPGLASTRPCDWP